MNLDYCKLPRVKPHSPTPGTIFNAYARLGNAIIAQGAVDYVEAAVLVEKNPEDRAARRTKKECVQFFHSDWFAQLTDIDGEELRQKLDEQKDELWYRYKLDRKSRVDKEELRRKEADRREYQRQKQQIYRERRRKQNTGWTQEKRDAMRQKCKQRAQEYWAKTEPERKAKRELKMAEAELRRQEAARLKQETRERKAAEKQEAIRAAARLKELQRIADRENARIERMRQQEQGGETT
jgi:hypothetical protein